MTVLLFMLILGGMSAGLYHYQTQGAELLFRWQEGLIATSWLLAAVCSVQFWLQLKHGSWNSLGSFEYLEWDGLFWHWTGYVLYETRVKAPPQTGKISIRFDGQSFLLLKFEPSANMGCAKWLWLEQAFAPERWHDVRRAVYSRAKEPVFNAPH